jgi:hypothetical protein
MARQASAQRREIEEMKQLIAELEAAGARD